MKKIPFLSNVILALVVGIFSMTMMLMGTLQPAVVLPRLDLPMLVALTALALALAFLLHPEQESPALYAGILGGLTFGLVPMAAGLVVWQEALLLLVLGGVIFGLLSLLMRSFAHRAQSGPGGKTAVVITALMLILASGALAGLI